MIIKSNEGIFQETGVAVQFSCHFSVLLGIAHKTLKNSKLHSNPLFLATCVTAANKVSSICMTRHHWEHIGFWFLFLPKIKLWKQWWDHLSQSNAKAIQVQRRRAKLKQLVTILVINDWSCSKQICHTLSGYSFPNVRISHYSLTYPCKLNIFALVRQNIQFKKEKL